MTKRVFRSICLVAVVVLMAAMSVIMGALYSYFTQVQHQQLRTQAELAARAVDAQGMEYLEHLEDVDCRITWISGDGQVLYDSEHASEQMENHLEREEIQEAMQTGSGESVRYSDTRMEQTIYAARKLSDGTILRVSTAQKTVVTLVLGMAQHICVVFFVAMVLALWLAGRLSQRIVEPLNKLDLDEPLECDAYEELSPLLRRIDSQQRKLRGQTEELKRRKREFDTVVGNMNEGLVLMNETCTVLTMTPAAARIMGLMRPYVGINFLTLDQAACMEQMLHTALEGQHMEQQAELSGNIYQIDASPVKSGGKVSGVVLLMFDNTQKERAEAQRREFTANVSHELKTPLHTISGYAELLKSGLVPASDMPEFFDKIYTEAQRMTRLVEDILKLSRLDEGSGMQKEPVDLYALCADVVRELQPMAEKAGVKLTLTGASCMMEGIPHLVSGIVTNLATNAIKYNRPGGEARVEIRAADDAVTLIVADTGIGIAPEHQERIFERFYRVDKSRSKEVGGTGLGLSIVKHAVMILGAQIELHSALGQGTTVAVRFPKNG